MLATRLSLLVLAMLTAGGCAFLPEISRQPSVHNPFPQLTKVAVAPFFNHSGEPLLNSQQFTAAYANELQSTPGFEVVPVTITENAIKQYGLTLSSPIEARKLAQLLEVDAVVIGAVTDYSPYYPPRCAMSVEWYSANPGYHPIPPGYGLPWGTPEEEYIPKSLVFEAEMALAREQLKSQEPAYVPTKVVPAAPAGVPNSLPAPRDSSQSDDSDGRLTAAAETIVATEPSSQAGKTATGLPHDWPNPTGFTPKAPSAVRPPLRESIEPVLSHTRSFNGHNADFTEALRNYVHFRDDARFGGWQAYLQRSDDFVRFCCHLHISEMLTARGGAGETRVVWRWATGR
jgi:hypothetical protein